MLCSLAKDSNASKLQSLPKNCIAMISPLWYSTQVNSKNSSKTKKHWYSKPASKNCVQKSKDDLDTLPHFAHSLLKIPCQLICNGRLSISAKGHSTKNILCLWVSLESCRRDILKSPLKILDVLKFPLALRRLISACKI